MLTNLLEKLKLHYSPLALIEARQRVLEGEVLNVRFSDGLVKGRIKTHTGKLLNLFVDLKTWPNVASQCSCQVSNCIHLACVLIALTTKNPLDAHNEVDKEDIILDHNIDWYSDLNTQKNHFFHYELGILIQGEKVNLLPLIADLILRRAHEIEALSDEAFISFKVSTKRTLKIPFYRIKPILTFMRYYAKKMNLKEPIEFNSYQILLIQEMEEALQKQQERWVRNEELNKKLLQIKALVFCPEIDPPNGLKGTLRSYQLQGFKWLQMLRQLKFGGVLADDMGLGKTVQTLAHLLKEKETGRLKKPCLILCPTSLLMNWFQEAKRFTPLLKVVIYHGSDREHILFEDYDLVISTYGLIVREKVLFKMKSFYYLILDEAQMIKNARTLTTQIIFQLKATHRLCLSGTPLENHLNELWSLYHFLMPGLLGDIRQFNAFFKIPIEKEGDEKKGQLLKGRIAPFLLRRTKNEVAQELPSKTEMTRLVELVGAQRDLYESIRMTMETKVKEALFSKGLAKSHFLILDALLKLRQICCDPRLLTLPGIDTSTVTSVKLDALMDLLDTLMAEKRHVLIFSQFTSMFPFIEKELQARKYAYLKLTGKTRNRHHLVEAFQKGTAPIFLISLRAGGTGLNLTRADVVIHYDPWWNPAVETQATDRTHRIGQVNPVFVYRLIAAGTVEEAIQVLQEKKKSLFKAMLSLDVEHLKSLTEEDIQRFFKPINGLQHA